MIDKVKKIFGNSLTKFVIVGGCSTAIDFTIYMLLSLSLSITLAKGIAMCISSIFSYIANKRFTFDNKEKTDAGYIFRFYIVFAANFGTNLGVNYLIFQNSGYKLFAYVLATVCGMTVNYLGQKFFVFKK